MNEQQTTSITVFGLSGTSGLLALLGHFLPQNLQDVSYMFGILAGICGIAYTIQSIFWQHKNKGKGKN